MANITSKEKNIKRIGKRTDRNRVIKSSTKKAIKKAKEATLANDKKAKELVSAAHKAINTAVSKGVYHKNSGARKQSNLDSFVKKNSKN